MSLPEGWEKAFDSAHRTEYFFHRASGLTQWQMPLGTSSKPQQVVDRTAVVPDKIAITSRDRGGLYYKDPYGKIQGPFTQEHIQGWRPYLPMDMMVWMLEEEDFLQGDVHLQQEESETAVDAAGSSVGTENPDEHGSAGAERELPEATPSLKRQKVDDEAAAPSRDPLADFTVEQLLECMPSVELAELLGDGMLLSEWRSQKEAGLSPVAPHAPPAPVWEHWLLYGPRSSVPQATLAAGAGPSANAVMGHDAEGPQDSRLAYAEAVLAGLPPDDEAVVISQLALSAGKSLQDVIDFSYRSHGTVVVEGPAPAQVDFSTAVRNPLSGRLTAAGMDEPQSHASMLYGEMSSWCNPEELERSLQEASKRKGQRLPAHVIQKLKDRKALNKKKAQASWLAS